MLVLDLVEVAGWLKSKKGVDDGMEHQHQHTILVIFKLPVSRRLAKGSNVVKRVHERAEMFEELGTGGAEGGGGRGGGWTRNSIQLPQTAYLDSADAGPNSIGPDPFSGSEFLKPERRILYFAIVPSSCSHEPS